MGACFKCVTPSTDLDYIVEMGVVHLQLLCPEGQLSLRIDVAV